MKVSSSRTRIQRNRSVEEGGLMDYMEAAEYLRTTPRHVRELWVRREVAVVKVGRSVRFAKSDLDAFIVANRVPARAWPSAR